MNVLSGLVAAFLLVGFGVLAYLGRSGRSWAFVVAGVIYALDALLLLLLQDWIAVVFHALGLWGIYQGWSGARELGGLSGVAALEAATHASSAASATVAPSAGRALKLVVIALVAAVVVLGLIGVGAWFATQ